jgi:ribosomal protein S18 acetylase RimI-like enzyme
MVTITQDKVPQFVPMIRMAAMEDGEEVGHVHVVLIHGDNPCRRYAYIEELHVSAAHRGKKVGSELMRSAIEFAKKQGCYKVVPCSRYENDAAHRLYDSLGFKYWGHERRLNLK